MRNLALASVALGLLASGQALGQMVTDVGEVFVDGDGNLSIGVDTSGSRTVDAENDGPYTSTTLGVNPGSSGTLMLDNGASFGTTGELAVGRQGSGLLEILGGSQLTSESAVLAPERAESSEVRVSGAGSSWVNTGVLDLSGGLASISIAGGANVRTSGISSGGISGLTQIVVEGHGSRLDNSGFLSHGYGTGNIQVVVRDGAVMADNGAGLIERYGNQEAVSIVGSGSLWTSRDITLMDNGVRILDGGSVEATSLNLLDGETGEWVVVSGVGSRLSVSGPVSVNIPFDGGGVLVSGGAKASSTGLSLSWHGRATISGPGSTWHNDGLTEIELGGSIGRFSITDGGQFFGQDAVFASCRGGNNPCKGVEVSGANSLWHNAGDVSLSGPTTVRAGGTMFVGNRLTVLDGGIRENGRLVLDDGVVQADYVSVDDGTLAGKGSVVGGVDNSGIFDPGDSETGTPGTLAIDGTYSQDATGSLEILLTGSAAHVFDKVTVTGTVDLAGELAISVGDSFATELGDRFTILEYASRTGEFDSVSGLQLGDGLSLRPVYSAEAMYLVTIPEPSTVLLLGAGLGLLGALRNRH